MSPYGTLPAPPISALRKISLLAAFLSCSLIAVGQAIPAATGPATAPGFSLPTTAGTMHYSLSVSETISLGYQGQDATAYSTNFSGNLGYLSGSTRHPFSMLYSAGYLASTGSAAQPSATYQDLGVSQVLNFGRYKAVVSDTVSYLPEAAAAGLSGIPGVGDANLPPGQFLTGAQGVLSNYATRVDNTLSGSVSRALTGKTSVTTRGGYTLDRFLGSQSVGAIEDNSYSFVGGVQHNINARTNFGANYNFTRYTYLGQDITTDSQGASVEFGRQLSRRSSLSLSAGPQYITSNSAFIPARLSFVANTGITYGTRDSSLSAGYNRSTGSGSGVVAGAITDAVQGSAQRRFGPSLHASVSVGYLRTRSLSDTPGLNFASNAIVGGFQANRAIIRYVSAYASYTLERQTYSGYTAANFTFNGLTQILGFGITYSPESFRVGHH